MAGLTSPSQPLVSVAGQNPSFHFALVKYIPAVFRLVGLMHWVPTAILAATSSLLMPLPASAVFAYYGDSKYTVVDGLTWEQAEANAISIGGHLVAINSAEENNWIKENFESRLKRGTVNSPGEGLWIGINNAIDPSIYQWTSGEEVTFTDWNADEPNNALEPGGTYQRYGILKWQGSDQAYIKWGDYWNTQQPWSSTLVPLGIAEIKLSSSSGTFTASVPGPLPILGLAAAFGFSRKLRKRIKLHKGTSAVSTSPAA